MTKIILIALAVIAIMALLVLRQHLRLKAKAIRCAKEARRFHEKLQKLSDPAHLFSDEELHLLKNLMGSFP